MSNVCTAKLYVLTGTAQEVAPPNPTRVGITLVWSNAQVRFFPTATELTEQSFQIPDWSARIECLHVNTHGTICQLGWSANDWTGGTTTQLVVIEEFPIGTNLVQQSVINSPLTREEMTNALQHRTERTTGTLENTIDRLRKTIDCGIS